MSDSTNMGNMQGIPLHDPASNHMPPNGPGLHNGPTEPIPPPSTSAPPPNEPPDDRNPRTPTPTGLRDFEGRRLYFANVCSTVSPHALHCIFRSYGPIRTFHYDTTLHYGYVVYMEREHALLARYGVDGLILGSRAIRVYYPPYKPRNPTRYCYNCREMGHFIQSCPYTNNNNNNNWEYNYSQLYNQGQPVVDHMNHPSSPMMQHFPTSQFMYPTSPVTTIPGQPGGTTMMYQPGWPGAQPTSPNMPFMPQYMGHSTPMPPHHSTSMPPHHPASMPPHHSGPMPPHHPGPMPPHHPGPMPPHHPGPMPPHHPGPMPSHHPGPMTPHHPASMPPHPHTSPLQHQMHLNHQLPQMHQPPVNQATPPPQMPPNINAMIQEQASAIIHQHISPMVQQVVSQIMQDPAITNLQQSMMQNMDPSTLRSGSYTVNEEPETASIQSGSMTMQHGSYTAMEEPRSTPVSQGALAQLMHNLQMPDADYMDIGKVLLAAQSLLQDQENMKQERAARRAQEMEEELPEPNNCCPVHNTPLTRVQKPTSSSAVTKTTTMHNGSTTTPRPQQYPTESIPPADQSTKNTSSSNESVRMAPGEPPADNQYYPQLPVQSPYNLPSSIFFTLPPIVVNITGPASYMNPPEPTPEQTKPPTFDNIPKNFNDNYNFIQENERNLREFEEVVRDDEQNYVENERNLRAQHSNIVTANIPPPPKSTKAPQGKTMKIVRGVNDNSVNVFEQTPKMSERERQRQDRLKLRAMLMDDGQQPPEENARAIVPVTQLQEQIPPEKKIVYTELLSTMNTSCTEIEKLFTNLSSLVGNPLAKKCLDQIKTTSEADILKLSQQLLHKIVDKDKPGDRDEILKLSNDLLKYANQKLPSTSSEAICEGAVGGLKNLDENVSSRSDGDSRKDDSDEGNYRRKTHWKKNKKRRR